MQYLHCISWCKRGGLRNGSWFCESSTDKSTSPVSEVLLAQIKSRFSSRTSKGLSSSSIIRFTADINTVWALLTFRRKICWRKRKACRLQHQVAAGNYTCTPQPQTSLPASFRSALIHTHIHPQHIGGSPLRKQWATYK